MASKMENDFAKNDKTGLVDVIFMSAESFDYFHHPLLLPLSLL